SGFCCVGPAGFAVPSTCEPFAPDQPRADNRNVMDALAPNQRIMPVIVPIILVRLPRALRFGGIVSASDNPIQRRWTSQNHSTLIKVKSHLALQMNGVAEINASREKNRASTGCRRSID